MFKNVNRFFFASILLFCTSATAQTVSEAVKDYCKCAAPVLEQAAGLMGAMNSGDMAQLTQIATFMEKNGDEMMKCMEDLEKKYEPLRENEEFEEQVKAGVQKECPNPLEKIGQAMGAMMQQ